MMAQIKIWIIEVGEPIPLPGENPRLMRAGQLAEKLNQLPRVNVTWWTSDFNHTGKRHYNIRNLIADDGRVALSNGVQARFLRGRGYSRNVSLKRILHNRDVAANFLRQIEIAPRPDVIFCCYPTINLAEAAASFGAKYDIPVVLDVRDLWPDAFVDVIPLPKALSKLLISPLQHKAKQALGLASAISAISGPILDWALEKAGRARNALDRVLPLSYDLPLSNAREQEAAAQQWHSLGLKLDGSEFIACAFGMLSDVPEFETIVDSLNYLPDDLMSRLRIVICGNGARLEWLQKAAKKHPQLLVPGYVNSNAISVLMKHSKAGLLAYPSRDDLVRSFPNKIGEYLAGGLPVVSTLSGASAELLKTRDCGIVVANRDPQAFASALHQLAYDLQTQHRMSCNAKEVYLDVFDARKNYNAMADFLISLAR